MTDEAEQSIPSRGSQVVAYAVIDDEGVQHSLWFLEKDAMSEAAMVGGTVVRLGVPTLTDEERDALLHAEEATAGMIHVYTDQRPGFDISEKLSGLRERLG